MKDEGGSKHRLHNLAAKNANSPDCRGAIHCALFAIWISGRDESRPLSIVILTQLIYLTKFLRVRDSLLVCNLRRSATEAVHENIRVDFKPIPFNPISSLFNRCADAVQSRCHVPRKLVKESADGDSDRRGHGRHCKRQDLRHRRQHGGRGRSKAQSGIRRCHGQLAQSRALAARHDACRRDSVEWQNLRCRRLYCIGSRQRRQFGLRIRPGHRCLAHARATQESARLGRRHRFEWKNPRHRRARRRQSYRDDARSFRSRQRQMDRARTAAQGARSFGRGSRRRHEFMRSVDGWTPHHRTPTSTTSTIQ